MTIIENTNSNRWKVFFIIFVTFYALLVLVKPNLAPTDDYVFIHTLQSGRPLLYHTAPAPGYEDHAKTGRWPTILGDMGYNLSLFLPESPSAFWYYFFHAFQYVILMVLFVKIISKFTSNKFLIYLTPILLSLTPAVTIPFFRTHIAERDLIFYYAIFLFFYLEYLEKPKLYYLILGVISANMAIQNKEIGFVALAVFAFCHLFLSWKKSKLGLKIFDGLVLFGSLIFLFLYYFIVYRNLPADAVLYSHKIFNSWLVFIKNIINYGFFSDPILIFMLLPLTAWRIYKFLRRQLELHPVYDSMLIAASMFVLAYFVLNIFAPNYLFPAYIFALPPLIYFFSQHEQKTILFKGVAIICGAVLIFNVFPTGIHYIAYYKYLPINFNKTLDFLVQDINIKHSQSPKRANIFIDAVDTGGGTAVYFIFAEFLQYKGLTWNKFDFKSNVETENNFSQYINDFLSRQPFTIFKVDNFSEMAKGDYLIITPDSTTKNITQDYLESLNKDYDLVFKTKSPLAFPNLNLKTLAKYFLSKILSQSQKIKQGVMINENLMQWPDYYVFVKK